MAEQRRCSDRRESKGGGGRRRKEAMDDQSGEYRPFRSDRSSRSAS